MGIRKIRTKSIQYPTREGVHVGPRALDWRIMVVGPATYINLECGYKVSLKKVNNYLSWHFTSLYCANISEWNILISCSHFLFVKLWANSFRLGSKHDRKLTKVPLFHGIFVASELTKLDRRLLSRSITELFHCGWFYTWTSQYVSVSRSQTVEIGRASCRERV